MNPHRHDRHRPAGGYWRSHYGIGFALFAAVALFFLLSEHRVHAMGALPYLLLATLPLVHVFMHRGHRHGHGGDHEDQARLTTDAASTECSRKTHHPAKGTADE